MRILPYLLLTLLAGAAHGRPAEHADVRTERYVEPQAADYSTFDARLKALEAGQRRLLRVVHIGDSEIADDYVAGTLRDAFQARYGNGGPGFAAVSKAWPWYHRNAWVFETSRGLMPRLVSRHRLADGGYGPGGATMEAKGTAEATANLKTPIDGPCEVSFFYQRLPEAAPIELAFDGVPGAQIDPVAHASRLGIWRRRLAACPKSFTARVTAKGPARLHGWNVEAERGIVWSSLGVISTRLPHLLRYPESAWGAALQALHPDLVVLSFGLNSVVWPNPPAKKYDTAAKAVFTRVRELVPGAPCLVMGVYPTGIAKGSAVKGRKTARNINTRLAAAAKSAGCAFLDRHTLVGGDRVLAKWRDRALLARDLLHLTAYGSRRMGERIFEALMGKEGARHLHPPG